MNAGAMTLNRIFRGALVLWLYKPRGGYGYVIPVLATVVSWRVNDSEGLKNVTIDAQRRDGTTVRRTVKAESLRFREACDSCVELVTNNNSAVSKEQ